MHKITFYLLLASFRNHWWTHWTNSDSLTLHALSKWKLSLSQGHLTFQTQLSFSVQLLLGRGLSYQWTWCDGREDKQFLNKVRKQSSHQYSLLFLTKGDVHKLKTQYGTIAFDHKPWVCFSGNYKFFKLASLHWLYVAQCKDVWKSLKGKVLVNQFADMLKICTSTTVHTKLSTNITS